MDIEIIPMQGNDVTHVQADRIRIKFGTTVFTLQEGGKPGERGLFLQKVDIENPLNEPVIITPIHTNKIKLS